MATEQLDSDKSTSALTADLVREVTDLVRDEFALARAEMKSKGKQAAAGAGMFGASAMLGFVGFVCLTGCAVAAISIALPVWLASLIVGGAYLVVAAAVAAVGRLEIHFAEPPLPTETLESARENVEWIRTHASSKNQ
jgi:hypothetical protein